jgi:UDP-N-acetylmuramyl pentapeptide phosphotransferase/UDP-N-acetylglucosamine-1-phosphate transferase
MSLFVPWQHGGELVAAGIAAALICAGLIVALMPALRRYALARPNARSSHVTPTPQGGGIAVVAATMLVATAIVLLSPEYFAGVTWPLTLLFLSAIALAAVGCIDDIWTIDVLPRLIFQFVAVIAIVAALPGDLNVIPVLPAWAEGLTAVIIGVWFVNLVNFMDGIDWITVVETAAIALGIVLIGCIVPLSAISIVIAIALLGATLGFAPFNRPVARLFLGDVGSLPIGLLLFWLLLHLAAAGHLAAAILLPLYYLADATVTLLRRAVRGERVTQAHRSHCYQVATTRGFSVSEVLLRIGAVNALLVVLALMSVWMRTLAADIATIVIGCAAVASLLAMLSRGKR